MDYDGKIRDNERKYITSSDCDQFTSGIFDVKIKQKELFNKSNLVKNSDLDTKFNILATKSELKAEQYKIK